VEGGYSEAISCDRNVYASVSAGATAGLLPASTILGFGYVGKPDDPQEPIASKIDNFLNGSTFSFTFGLGVGQQLLSSRGVDGVVYFGGLDAAVSFVVSYSFASPGNVPSPHTACGHGAIATSSFQKRADPGVSKPGRKVQVSLAAQAGKAVRINQGGSFFVKSGGFGPGTDVRLSLSARYPLGVVTADTHGNIGISFPPVKHLGLATLTAVGRSSNGSSIARLGRIDVVRPSRK
jgi:hypothetical protein